MPGDGLAHGAPATKKLAEPIRRHSLRDGLTAYTALSWGTGFSCPRRARASSACALSTSVGVPGPHGITLPAHETRWDKTAH
jgi:hypothetical protein